jgi:hypothetical protein
MNVTEAENKCERIGQMARGQSGIVVGKESYRRMKKDP